MNEPNVNEVEVSRASALADRIENNEKLNKILFRSIFLLLTVIFVVFLVWGINKVLLTEGTEAMPAVYMDSLTPLPQTGGEAVGLLDKLLKGATDEKATKVSVKTSFKLDDESLTVSDDEKGLIKASILLAKDEMLDNLAKYYEDKATRFGEPLADLLLPVNFTASELKSWEVKEEADKLDISYVFPTTQFKSLSATVKASMGMNKTEGFLSYAKEKLLPEFEITDIELTCGEPTISMSANRVNHRLNSVTYNRTYMAEAAVRFGGDLESLGERRLSFVFTSTTKYSFSWAGVRLSDSVLWLEKGKTDVIEAFRTADELLDVTWSTSDESIVSVDSDGYVKGHKTSPDPVTITATFLYLGRTYTAECLVYVVVPVKDAKLNTRELTLKAGETATLTAKISPEKATVKTVRWFTTDENVTVVDENGKVTAVAPGECKVYCITENMNFKRSCEITVEG